MEAKIEEQRNEALRRESRALLAWSNTFLTKRKLKAEVVERDFADGVLLINLVETVFNASLGKFNMTPKLSIHKMENIGKAFEWLEKEMKIIMQGIDPNDLVKKTRKTDDHCSVEHDVWVSVAGTWADFGLPRLCCEHEGHPSEMGEQRAGQRRP